MKVKDGFCLSQIRGTTLYLQTRLPVRSAGYNHIPRNSRMRHVAEYSEAIASFDCALRGPFDALRCARLSVTLTPCNCTLHRYLHFFGFYAYVIVY